MCICRRGDSALSLHDVSAMTVFLPTPHHALDKSSLLLPAQFCAKSSSSILKIRLLSICWVAHLPLQSLLGQTGIGQWFSQRFGLQCLHNKLVYLYLDLDSTVELHENTSGCLLFSCPDVFSVSLVRQTRILATPAIIAGDLQFDSLSSFSLLFSLNLPFSLSLPLLKSACSTLVDISRYNPRR
jgi:hypothetical protein